ncbi:hypothetical protein [Planobispora takensis]|uniref:hypothetical protein n=1 Tax=Planobispora takensis TaxID=1367882 RepID=UPI0019417E4B|nr:hypothetical protein [Planobispora takensis]
MGQPGLYSRILVIVDGTAPVENEYDSCYMTPIAPPGSGQGYYTLTAPQGTEGAERPADISVDEAKLSQGDSEVAALLDAYEWITTAGFQAATESIRIVLVSNIGPCNACKARLQIFYNDVLTAASDATSKASITVESIYDTGDAFFDTERGNRIATTYGYRNATKTPYDISGQKGSYWQYVLPRPY